MRGGRWSHGNEVGATFGRHFSGGGMSNAELDGDLLKVQQILDAGTKKRDGGSNGKN